MNPHSLRNPTILVSLMAAILAFGIDRAQKGFHIAAECYAIGQALCVPIPFAYEPLTLTVATAIARSAAQPFTYAHTYPSQSVRRSGEVERGEWKSGLPEWLRQKR